MTKMSVQLSLQFLVFAVVVFQPSQELPKCSTTFCPSREDECKNLDRFRCYSAWIMLPAVEKFTRVRQNYNESKHLNLTANDDIHTVMEKGRMSFEDANLLWTALAHADINGLTISNFCDKESDSAVSKKCNLSSTSKYETINIDYFLPMNTTKFLNVIASCAGNVTGNLQERFPKLAELSFKGNFLKELPLSIRNLTGIRKLNLENNIIDKVITDDFGVKNVLTDLNLGDNCLQILPRNAFSTLSHLQTLDLQNNRIEYLPDNLLDGTPNLTKFVVRGNELTTLPNQIFSKTSSIKTIDIRNNKISALPEDLLGTTHRLRNFFISDNKLQSIPENFFQNCLKLKSVDFGDNVITALPAEIFHGLSELQFVILKNNQLSTLDIGTFRKNQRLQVVDIANNNLNELPTIKLQRENGLIDISNNKISEIKGAITNKISNFESLLLSGNCLRYTPDVDDTFYVSESFSFFFCENCCLAEVYPTMLSGIEGMIYLAKNNITEITEIDFDYLMNQEEVDLSDNQISRITIPLEYLETKLKPSTKINFARNPMSCDCSILNFWNYIHNTQDIIVRDGTNDNNTEQRTAQFDYRDMFNVDDVVCATPLHLPVHNLPILNLTRDHFENYLIPADNPHCTYNSNCYEDTTYVNCSNAGLVDFPKFYPNATEKLVVDFRNNGIRYLPSRNDSIWNRMTSLDLTNNQISSLVNLTCTSSLTSINLQNNKLTEFEPELIEAFRPTKTNRAIWLSGNPWICNCELRDKLNVIFSGKNVQVPDQNDLMCDWKGKEYKFYDFDIFCESQARKEILSAVLTSITALVIFSSLLGFVFFKYKLQIKYCLFTRNLCLWWVSEEDLDADKEFDAFISYSGLDSEWVGTVLVPGLENKHPRYKICVHERDWPGGVLIADQIVRSIESSRRTILVLTENFLNSEWSRVEFTVAFQRSIEDKVNRVIVVVPYELPDLDKYDSEFRSFVKLTTYIEFKKRYFWRMLRYSMPRRRSLVIHVDDEDDQV